MGYLKLLTLSLALVALPLMAADNSTTNTTSNTNSATASAQDINPTSYVKVTTNLGSFVLGLDATKAPQTVQNFLQYVNSGFYNNTIFHRVISGFMIQGGGFNAQFQRKETRPPITNEASNGLSNKRGTIAMARTFDPQSATSQFFINLVDNNFLDYRASTPADWGYCVFGKVVSGMDVVDSIGQQQTGPGGPFPKDVPLTLVIIENMQVVPAPATTTTNQ